LVILNLAGYFSAGIQTRQSLSTISGNFSITYTRYLVVVFLNIGAYPKTLRPQLGNVQNITIAVVSKHATFLSFKLKIAINIPTDIYFMWREGSSRH